jgi:hypothetical protein
MTAAVIAAATPGSAPVPAAIESALVHAANQRLNERNQILTYRHRHHVLEYANIFPLPQVLTTPQP